jgi:hypothetical protein
LTNLIFSWTYACRYQRECTLIGAVIWGGVVLFCNSSWHFRFICLSTVISFRHSWCDTNNVIHNRPEENSTDLQQATHVIVSDRVLQLITSISRLTRTRNYTKYSSSNWLTAIESEEYASPISWQTSGAPNGLAFSLQRAGMTMRKILPKLHAFDQQVDSSFWKDKKRAKYALF